MKRKGVKSASDVRKDLRALVKDLEQRHDNHPEDAVCSLTTLRKVLGVDPAKRLSIQLPTKKTLTTKQKFLAKLERDLKSCLFIDWRTGAIAAHYGVSIRFIYYHLSSLEKHGFTDSTGRKLFSRKASLENDTQLYWGFQ